jgi:hypothetical protein
MVKTKSGLNRRGRPHTGKAASVSVRMRRMRERRRTAGLRAVVRWEPLKAAPAAPWSDHRLHDLRSLIMHGLIASQMAKGPEPLRRARANIRRWRARFDGATPRWWQEWSAILKRPTAEIAAELVNPDQRATRLRQSSPFAGVLTAAQRKRVYEAFRT